MERVGGDDPPTVAAGVQISATPATVWQLVCDITLMPTFSDELQSVAWSTGTSGPRLGAEFTGVNRHPAMGEWTTRSTITAFVPECEFEWTVGDPDRPAAIWRYELTPHTDGTLLRYVAQIGPGRSGVSMLIGREPRRAAEIVASRLGQFERGMAATLSGLKALAES